jgi:AcrR family transcriptional regulator
VPADERRAERRARLLDVAFDLLGTEGTSSTTVRAVCRAAELNQRYFYENFDDIDALLVAVYDRTVGELYEALAKAAWASGLTPESRLRAGIETAVAFVDSDRRRGRVLFVEARGIRAVDEHRAVAWQRLIDGLSGTGRPGRGAPTTGVELGKIRAGMLAGGFTTLLVEWLDGRLDVSRERLIDEATAVSMRIAGRPVPLTEPER